MNIAVLFEGRHLRLGVFFEFGHRHSALATDSCGDALGALFKAVDERGGLDLSHCKLCEIYFDNCGFFSAMGVEVDERCYCSTSCY